MIRVVVMANDSLLADSIASTLAEEIDLDVVRLTLRELQHGDRHSVVILVEEEESKSESIRFTDLFRDDLTLLLIRVSLESRDIFVYESYQLNNPAVERVIDLVRDFGRANLKKKIEEVVSIRTLQEAIAVSQLQVYGGPVAHDS